MKELRIAQSAGFCFGVKRSVEMAEELLRSGPVTSLGELIHNGDVVDRLRSRGLRVIESAEEAGEGERVMIRAHGVSRLVTERLAQRGAVVSDATCPKVRAIHKIVSKAAAEGRFVLIIGMRNHPEVEGICGWCEGHQVLENPEEVTAWLNNYPDF